MSAPVTVAAPAKINLQLGVGPRRPDGYHGLATVYQAIGLHDEVTVRAARASTVRVVGEGVQTSGVPADGSNLAARAARLLASHAGLAATDAGVALTIRKRIPVAGGMAGGSTDAAAALLACDTLWELGTPHAELLRLAARLGSDVPFCLLGGTATGSGRGEVVSPVTDRGEYWWVVAPAGEGLSTPAVYAEFDRSVAGAAVAEPEVSTALLAALAAGDTRAVGRALSNDLQAPALALRPDLAGVLDAGGRPPAVAALLSGSGPTCLFLTEDEAAAETVRDGLREAGSRAVVARGPVAGPLTGSHPDSTQGVRADGPVCAPGDDGVARL